MDIKLKGYKKHLFMILEQCKQYVRYETASCHDSIQISYVKYACLSCLTAQE